MDCLVCDHNESCKMSAVPMIFGDGAQASPDKLCNVENQQNVWLQGQQSERGIAERLAVNK